MKSATEVPRLSAEERAALRERRRAACKILAEDPLGPYERFDLLVEVVWPSKRVQAAQAEARVER